MIKFAKRRKESTAHPGNGGACNWFKFKMVKSMFFLSGSGYFEYYCPVFQEATNIARGSDYNYIPTLRIPIYTADVLCMVVPRRTGVFQ